MSTEVPFQLYWRTGRKEADYTFRQLRSFGVGTDTSDRPNKVGFTRAVGSQWNGLRPPNRRKLRYEDTDAAFFTLERSKQLSLE